MVSRDIIVVVMVDGIRVKIISIIVVFNVFVVIVVLVFSFLWILGKNSVLSMVLLLMKFSNML